MRIQVWLGGVFRLAEVKLQEGETLENALRRFKRKVQQEDIIKEVKRHSFYLKPGEKLRVKQALARKRNRKKSAGKSNNTYRRRGFTAARLSKSETVQVDNGEQCHAGISGPRPQMRRLRSRFRLYSGRTALLPRQEFQERTQALQGL